MDYQFFHTIDVEKAESEIVELGDASVESLHDFGTLLFGEVQARSSQLDSKLTTILGWASAMLAFVGIDLGLRSMGLVSVSLASVAAALAFSALMAAALGLKSQKWIIPSEEDWFRDGLLEHPDLFGACQ